MRRTFLVALASVPLLLASGARADDAPGGPRIRVEPETFDFGKALPGKTLRKEFTLRNFGNQELVLQGISTTCGCTAALAGEEKIAPGGSTSLRVTLETRSYKGRVERRVLVRSNDPQTPLLEIRVSVTVEAEEKKR
jgi:hypothetical protein